MLDNFKDKNVGLIIFIYTLLPFIVLSFLSVPLGDDFWYAKSYIDNGFLQTQTDWFQNWSGRYTSNATISFLNPVSFNQFSYSFILPIFLLVSFAWSLKTFIHSIDKVFLLKINKTLLFSLLFFFYINYLPDIGESFFWTAGAFTYQLPLVLMLLYLNQLIYIYQSNTTFDLIKNYFLALVFLVIILGCNEVIVVYCNAINFCVLALLFLNKLNYKRFIIVFLITIMISLFMILAPGNFGRAVLFEKSDFHLFKVIAQASSRSIFLLFFWIPTLILVLLNIPIYKSESKFNYFLPAVLEKNWKLLVFILGFIFCLMFVGFFPSIYATNWIPQRAYTPIFFSFMLLGVLLFYTFYNKLEVFGQINKTITEKGFYKIILPLLVVALSSNSNVMNAYVDITSGKAISYNKQVMSTYKMLNSTTKDTVFIDEIAKKPLILPIRWPEKSNKLVNEEWENYFEIKCIELK